MANSLGKDTSRRILKLSAQAGRHARSNKRSLPGLSVEETAELEALDALPPLDENGNIAWTFEGEPTTLREKRWLALYKKHQRALKARRSDPKATRLDARLMRLKPPP